MLKAIIIDDQQVDINNLTILLKEHKKLIKLLGGYTSVEAGIEGIQVLKPDVLFLDVELSNNQTGFDLLKWIKEPDFEIIFTTAHDKYAARAFRIAAIDYLLKPVAPFELLQSLQRLEYKNSLADRRLMRESLLESLNSSSPPRSINIRTKEKIFKLYLDDIIYCEASINYTKFQLRNKSTLTVSQTIKDFEDILDSRLFYRIHKSYIVNFKHIKTFMRKDGVVILSDDTKLEVADRRKTDFKNEWDKYKGG